MKLEARRSLRQNPRSMPDRTSTLKMPEIAKVTISVLAENTARGPGILGEHGLSWWIDTGDHRMLFDTGQGMIFQHNAEKLGIDLSEAESIVFSHGHNDHVGGVQRALDAIPGVPVYAHPRAFERKFIRRPDGPACISIDAFEDRSVFAGHQTTVVEFESPTEVIPDIWATGTVPRMTDFEDVGGPFFLDEELARPDPISDDISLFWRSSNGIVILLGCAHAGVVNIGEYVLGLTGEKTIHAVLGGMHLLEANQTRIEATIAAFRRWKVQKLGAVHCTGDGPRAALMQAFPAETIPVHSGARLEI